MQTVVDAFNEGKVITSVVQMSGGKGSKITFNDGTSIEIVNGKDAPVIELKSLNCLLLDFIIKWVHLSW